MLKKFDRFFEARKEYGAIFVRLIVGWRLIDGSQDNILSWKRMLEFSDFLQVYGFPLPIAAACISVYAQFICGIFFILGAFTRIAAGIMIFNFIVALLAVHIGTTFLDSFDALVILFASLFLLFNGAGGLAIDNHIGKKQG